MAVTTDRPKTTLAANAAAEGGVLGQYCGVKTTLRFSSVDAELQAIIETCGVYDLGWRGKIAATGGDRARWLNGMVTNNIKDLPLNRGNYNFLLSAQGRIQGDMYVYNRGERLLLDTEKSQIGHLVKTLEHFIIMDDVELTDVSEQVTSIGVQGPQATDVLKAVGLKPECADPLAICDLKWNGGDISITRMANDDYLTYEIWLAPAQAVDLWDALRKAGATAVGAEALEKFRVIAGVPRYGVDIRDKDLPQETQQNHALNFTKGCYIGQEIVERIRSRGNVHRKFSGFELNGATAPGTRITDGSGKEVGEITTAAEIRGQWRALGYIRREAEGNHELNAGGVMAKPASLPFKQE